MFMLGLFSWWYGAGWAGVLGATNRRLLALADVFSIDILVRTLFAPWKRVISYPGASLDAKVRAALDNLVSRLIGFTVRVFVLLTAATLCVLLLLLGLLELVLWPLLPMIALGFIVKGML